MAKITLTFTATSHGVDYGRTGLEQYSDKELNSLQWAMFTAREDVECIIKRRVDKRIDEVNKLKPEVKDG